MLCGIVNAGPADRWSCVDSQGVLRWRDDESEIALFGVNYYTPFTIDHKGLAALGADHRKAIERDVAHFDRLGLDAIRLHVFDRQISDLQGNLLANEHLRLFDYLVAECKRRGLYTVLTPIAWWSFHVKGKGFSSLYTKPQMVLDPNARKAQCNYLRQFMEHVNWYTGHPYRDESAVVAIELINEPLYSRETPAAQITEYIDALARAVRATGARQPIFYNGWAGKEQAVADSIVEGCTFGWYPTGLMAGHCLRGNYLVKVDDYPRMRLPCLAKKAKIVYEFDAADVPGRVMYPAMARAFRSGGAQIATQFQYDPLPLAPYNYGWQTHYLNLVHAPGKAVSFAIAAEAFRRTPRLARFDPYPENTAFGPFRLSFEDDLSEMVTEEAFLYSNNTRTVPPTSEMLRRVMGCGSSPIVQYGGTGAYFLDRIVDGVWRLETYPDAVWVADPHGKTSLQREVSRLLWRSHRMTIQLPDLGGTFAVSAITPRRPTSSRAHAGGIVVAPGAYVLTRTGVTLPSGVTSEFYAPHPKLRDVAVWCELPKCWREGRAMSVRITIAASDVARAILHVGERSVMLRETAPYVFAGEAPGRLMGRGRLDCWLEVQTERGVKGFPAGALEARGKALPPAKVCEIAKDTVLPDLTTADLGGYECKASIVPGSKASSPALRMCATGFAKAPCATGLRLPARSAGASGYTTVCIRARAIEKATDAMELGLVQDDGRAYGYSVPLWPQWHNLRIPIAALRPLWQTRGGRLDATKLKEVSLVFGAWLYGEKHTQPHGFEVERVWLEQELPRWHVEVCGADSPVPLFTAGEHRVRAHGTEGVSQSIVRGSAPGLRALRVQTKGFGPSPSGVSFRSSPGPDLDVWRDILGGCDTLEVVARAGHPATRAFELVVLETDGAPWGTVVELNEEWRRITLPLKALRFFGHWSHPKGRGGDGDRLQPVKAAAVNFCFGAWLYGDQAGEPHAVEVQRVAFTR